MENYINKIQNFSFANVQPYSGLIIAAIGFSLLLASIFDANWLFNSNLKSYNIDKIEG